ncbi:MAG TPA: efflux RND transporter periplasmic adaptor subunit [Candidatus Baltobacteraceae bacterium]|nr:efflux RND transporter periplasmic adaptor subunit [Candidatus Baltobacteraceae bacterium]
MNYVERKVSARKSRIFARSVLLLGGAIIFHGCSSSEKEPTPLVTVQVAPAKRGPIELEVTSDAVVYPLQQAILTPKITSTIAKFYVQRGSRVKQGQLLAVLENRDLAGAAEQSKGEFEQAEASYATTVGASLPQQIQKAELDARAAKLAFDAQQKVYDARKQLYEQGALPRRDFDLADVGLAQARSANEQAQKQLADLQRLGKEQALKSAGGQLSASKGKLLNAQAQLSYSEIRSPIDGVVTDRPQFQGELATANQPLLTVMNTSRLIAKAHISQSEAVLLKVGNQAEIELPGLEEPIKAKVSLVSPALDPGSTTIEVWVESTKPNAALKPGMSARVNVIAKSEEDALVVPASAVYKSEEAGDYVMLAGSDKKAHLTKVKVGIKTKELAQIESGIKENDSVITVGGYALPDGTQIQIEATPAPEPEKGGAADDKSPKDKAGDEKPAAPAKPAKGKE